MTKERPNGAFQRVGELAFAPNRSRTPSSDDPLEVTYSTFGDTFDTRAIV
jgi:hypothetical protein